MILPLLLCAATVALISRTEKPEREIAIAVTFDNLADNLLLMDAQRHSVRLLVSDAAAALKTIDTNETSCRVDLSGLGEGTHTLTVHPSNIGLPKGVALQTLLTPSLTLKLETVSQKTAGVIAILEGQPAPGFAVVAVSLQPERILLKGTATMLAGIDTVKTLPINLEDAAESFKKEVPLNLPETVAVDPPLRIVVAHVEVRERIITRVLENMPVSVKGTFADFQVHPDAIKLTVKGPEAIVNSIETDRGLRRHCGPERSDNGDPFPQGRHQSSSQDLAGPRQSGTFFRYHQQIGWRRSCCLSLMWETPIRSWVSTGMNR